MPPCALFILSLQIRLDPLDVPIAEIAPEKLVHALRALMKSIIRQRVVHLFHRPPPAAQKSTRPAAAPYRQAHTALAHVPPEPRARSSLVPHCSNFSRFTNKNRAAFQILLAKFRAPASRSSDNTMSVPGRGHGRQAKSHRIRAVLLIQSHRIKPGSFGLGHFLAAAGAHQRMQIHRAEGNLAGKVHPQHDHPRHPEKQDVVPGDQQ